MGETTNPKFEILYRRTADLVPYARNARTHTEEQVAQIAGSIREFGFDNPVLIDAGGTIIAGHGRVLAAQKLGILEVPTIDLSHLSETKKKARAIVDNKIALNSSWDQELLRLELEDLTLEGVDLSLLAFSDDELKKIMHGPEDQLEDDEFGEKEPSDTYIKVGDLLELNRHRVICGDCTDKEVVEKLVLEELNLIVTDPPYGVSYVGKTDDALTLENDELPEEDVQDLWRRCLGAWVPRLEAGGGLYVSVPAGPLYLIFGGILHEMEMYRQQLVWVKDSMVLGRSDYHYRHETILYGWKPGAPHNFINNRAKTSVFELPRPKASREHPTMKPLPLWGEFITNSSSRGQRVGDPFLGSGTTLIACETLGRTCYGTEISPTYCHVIVERYKRYCQEKSLPFEGKLNGEPLE